MTICKNSHISYDNFNMTSFWKIHQYDYLKYDYYLRNFEIWLFSIWVLFLIWWNDDFKFRPTNFHGHNEYFLMTDSFYAGKYKNVKFHEGYVSICLKRASLKEYSFWFSLTSIKYNENKRNSWEFSLVTLDAEIVITKIWQFDYDYLSI